MEQSRSFAQREDAGKKKVTRRDQFLGEMEKVVPWARLVAIIQPDYPTGQRGRPPVGLGRRLRSSFLPQWSGLAEEALEDPLDDRQARRGFTGLDLGGEAVPEATTEEAEGKRGRRWTGEPLLHFRHLLEAHALTTRLLAEVHALLGERQWLLRAGTLVDATIIAAPSSTKNQAGARDPEPERSGDSRPSSFPQQQSANAPDQERQPMVFGDEGAPRSRGAVRTGAYGGGHGGPTSQTSARRTPCCMERKKPCMPPPAPAAWKNARRSSPNTAGWSGASPPGAGRSKRGPRALVKDLTLGSEQLKARARALVEPPFHIVKNLFQHRKVRYRGLQKNTAQPQTLFALANLVIAKKHLLRVRQAPQANPTHPTRPKNPRGPPTQATPNSNRTHKT